MLIAAKAASAVASAALVGTGAVGVAAADSSGGGYSPSCTGEVVQVCTMADGSESAVRGNRVYPSNGVDFRDNIGNKTGSGVYPNAELVFLGQSRQGKNGDGLLVRVMQRNSPGVEGYGDLYDGWIPVKFIKKP